jgi:hypothetical protein
MTPMLGILASSISGSKAVTNSYESIATTTVSTPVSTITFSSIPATYKHLQVRAILRSTASGGEDSFLMRLNSDSGSNYSYHFLSGDGSGVGTTAASSSSFIYPYGIPAASYAANCFGVKIIDLIDYADTNKYKTIKNLTGYEDNSTGGRLALTSGSWRNTGAVSTITFTNSGNFPQYSSFALYGIKG